MPLKTHARPGSSPFLVANIYNPATVLFNELRKSVHCQFSVAQAGGSELTGHCEVKYQNMTKVVIEW